MEHRIAAGHKWQIAAAVGSGIFLGTFSGSVVAVALPTLMRILQTDFATVQWVLLAYSLAVGTLVIGAGRLGDILGSSRVYGVGFSIFTLGSLLCGLAPTVGWLIAARALQGVGASLTTALSAVLLTEVFPPAQRGKAYGLNGALVAAGFVLGPAIGGQLLSYTSWRWVFFANVPLGALATWAVIHLMPATSAKAGKHFDLAGAATLFVHLLTLLLALSFGQKSGFNSPAVVYLLTAAAVSFLLFLWAQHRGREPMVPLRIFRQRRLSLNLLTGFLTFFTLTGTGFLLVFYLEGVLGLNPGSVGGILAVLYTAMGVASPLSGALTDRFGHRLMRAAGLAVLLAGYLLILRLETGIGAAECLLFLLPVGIGTGIFIAPNQKAILEAVPREQLGLASSLLAEMRTFGQSTGVALLGSLWGSRVAHHASGSISPVEAPVTARMAGFQETFLVMAALIALALGLVIWDWIAEHRAERATAEAVAGTRREEPAA